MNITISRGRLTQAGAELLVVPCFLEKGFSALAIFGNDMVLRAERLAKAQEFIGRAGQSLLLPISPGHGADMLLLVGVGDKKQEGFLDAVREAAGLAVQMAKKAALRTLAVDFSAREFNLESVEAFASGLLLANYHFDAYKKENGMRKIAEVDLLIAESKMALAMRKTVERVHMVLSGVTIARDLVNVPAHDMTPERLAQASQEIAKESGGTVKVKVLGRAECEKLGMGAFLAVAQGADREPKFIHLSYTSPRSTKKTVAVVGKGVTFDSGGLSLKPADAMMTMKCDMAGAAAVIGLFAILARLRPRLNVQGYIAATENMPSSKAIRPGDIVRSMSGKTIEILNTDAEGRLTLADAMTYALKDKPDAIVDLATLTGACMVALGEEIAGLMTNDRGLAKQFVTAAKEGGEKLWEMPLEKRYRELVVSDVADLRNIATSKYGGSLTAGLFLQEFIPEGTAWAHLDIAGPAFAEKPMGACLQKGATGYGVRTLWKWIEGMAR